MCKKNYKHSEETKKKISDKLKGQSVWNKGKKRSEETKRKISETKKRLFKEGKIKHPKGMLGKHHTKETKEKISSSVSGKNHPLYGTHMSDKTKEKMSKTKTGVPNFKMRETIKRLGLNKGDKNPNWKGGLSFEAYPMEFNNELKEKVRSKFGRKCVECNYSEKKLGYKINVHHVDYDKMNNSEDNFITLCNSCHMKTNFKRENWTDYFQDKLKGGLL